MTNVSAREVGRRLEITVGDPEIDRPEDLRIIDVRPAPSTEGAAMYALWVGVVFGLSSDAPGHAEKFSKWAVGEENEQAVEDLRSDESSLVVNAALLWNLQGGTIEAVNRLLRGEDGEDPKESMEAAKQMLLSANGHSQISEQLLTLLSGVSASQIPIPDAFRGTNTPSGSSTRSKTPVAPGRPPLPKKKPKKKR